MIPNLVQSFLEEHDYGPVTGTHSVAGGCISSGKIITTQSGVTFFLKFNPNTAADMFAREAEGLNALQVDDGPIVPDIFLHGRDFILLEDLAPAPPDEEYWPSFGRKLAALHNHTDTQFGFDHDNYIGSTRQPNPRTVDGHKFFIESRLHFQAQMAKKRGFLAERDMREFDRIINRLERLVPHQPASLIHGDLWSGNAITNSNGAPAIIDPAVHYGWAEAELAMTQLFGAFPTSFYKSYEEIRPLKPGYHERFPIYNLYHLINHLNIFGRGYIGQVQAILRRYS